MTKWRVGTTATTTPTTTRKMNLTDFLEYTILVNKKNLKYTHTNKTKLFYIFMDDMSRL